MARLVPSLILGATLAACPFAFAAEPAPAAVPAETNPAPAAIPPVLAPSAGADRSAPTPVRPRVVSPGVASILKSAMPIKYDPEAAKVAAAKAVEEGTAETDAPKNGIVRLSPVIVQGRRPAIFKPYQIYTKQGMREYAFRQYITSEVDRALNRFTLPLFGISAYERAMQMYYEDERLRNMADTADMARFVSLTDPDAGMYVKRVAEKTYMRSSDFGWNGGKSGNTR
jgi:hypothetical protein